VKKKDINVWGLQLFECKELKNIAKAFSSNELKVEGRKTPLKGSRQSRSSGFIGGKFLIIMIVDGRDGRGWISISLK